jgi:hypothetical protein
MNSLQIREKNIITSRIKTIKNQIERNKETISRLSSQNKITEFDKKQINERENKNTEYLKEIETQEKRLIDLSNGTLNSELNDMIIQSQENLTKQKDKIDKQNKDKEDKKIIQKTYFQKSFHNSEKRNLSEKQLFYAYKKFENFRIPAYITRNLNDMPNNKGYILTDSRDGQEIWCFGKLKEEHNKPTTMFKKLKDDILHIYEIDDSYRTIYEKKGKNHKTLISKEERRKIC